MDHPSHPSSYKRHASERMRSWADEDSRERDRAWVHDRERDLGRERERIRERAYAEPRRTITRVNRACTTCRRAKMRCIGSDKPPCERCRTYGVDCVLEKPVTKDLSSIEERMNTLETQMGNMRELVDQVVDTLRTERPSRQSGVGTFPAARYWHPSADSEPIDVDSFGASPEVNPRKRSHSAGSDLLVMDEMSNPLGGLSAVAKRVEKEGQHAAETRKPAITAPEGHDLIASGVISEAEARNLVDVFYSGSHAFINAYDPTRDDFPSLRHRSLFSLTAVMFVGARAQASGLRQATLKATCLEAAKQMAMRTLVNGGNVEDIKALILLAAFNANGWLMAGHAVRLATELGLNNAFNELLARGMGAGKNAAELEEERELVEKARVWYCIYRLEHQMSYGLGRPAIVREDGTIHNCRLLLDHPLSLESDVRLIYSVELLALRAPLHVELTAAPDEPLDTATLARLRWANDQFDAWERYWDDILFARYAPTNNTTFVHDSLAVQRQLAELFINSQLLRGVHSPEDVEAMSAEKRALALRALGNALRCVHYTLRGKHYPAAFPYGTHYSHICMAFAASFLVRIARLFPKEMDLAGVARDVEEIADVLDNVPAGRYSRSLRLLLRLARRREILPAANGASSSAGISKKRRAPEDESTTLTPTLDARDWLAMFGIADGASTSTHTPSGSVHTSDLETLSRFGFIPRPTDSVASPSQSLPLFLSGDLGTTVRPSDPVNFVGLEDYFLPAELDDMLSSQRR